MIDFEGFEPANTTPVPDVLFDELLPELTEAELKILLYIIRRTWGFKKVTDAISLNQFQHGITTRDGKVLDKGCGIKNRTTLVKGLASLEKRKCIQSEKGTDAKGDKATTLYSICFKNSGVVRKTYQGSAQNVPPVVTEAHYRSAPSGLPVVRKTYPQETVIQETVKQESTNATSDEDRLTRTEIKTAFTHVLPEVQAEVTLRRAQQGDEHATIPSRSDTRVATGTGTRPSSTSTHRHAAQETMAGAPRPQTSDTAAEAVLPGNGPGKEGIVNESSPLRDGSTVHPVEALGVRSRVEAMAGPLPVQVKQTASAPFVSSDTGAAGSAPPQGSGPRRPARKPQQQNVTQAELPPASKFHLTEQEEQFWGLWCQVWFNKDIPPDLNKTAYGHVVKLAPHITTPEQLESLMKRAKKDLEDAQGIKRKTVYLGNLVTSYPGWKQEQQPAPALQEQKKALSPKEQEERERLAEWKRLQKARQAQQTGEK